MTEFSPGSAILGGVLIGLSASLFWAFNGKVAGISGIVAGLVAPLAAPAEFCPRADSRASTRSLRALFVLGLLLGGGLLWSLEPALLVPSPRPISLLLGAGFLVGIGTQLSGGCTSGHGVCGISRGALRSLVATGTFVATAALSVFLLRTLLGAGS
jgi:uncharacterized membrane protein YedE/YeeE